MPLNQLVTCAGGDIVVPVTPLAKNSFRVGHLADGDVWHGVPVGELSVETATVGGAWLTSEDRSVACRLTELALIAAAGDEVASGVAGGLASSSSSSILATGVLEIAARI